MRMLELTAREVAKITGAKIALGDPETIVRDVATDNREVEPGGTFVAFVGENVDGNLFAPAAVEAGAACVVATAEPSRELLAAAEAHGALVMRAADDDPTAWLLELAGEWRRRHDWLCVGITGSVGKTTTKELTLAALSGSFACHANAGNRNSVIGIPQTIFAAPETTQVLICEMGMNHVGEIAAIARCAKPRVGAVTNIGTSHIGLLGSREAIARAKGEMVVELAASEPSQVAPEVGPLLVLSADDDFTPFIEEEICAPAGLPVLEVGAEPEGELAERDGEELWADEVVLDAEGRPRFTLHAGGEAIEVALALTGLQAVPDALVALAIARHLGIDPEVAAKRLERVGASAMRADLKEAPGGWRVIDDTYNASPTSVAAALTTLSALEPASKDGRRIAVLGEVGELGSEAPRLHGLMGAYVAAMAPDLTLFVGAEGADAMAEAASIMGYGAGSVLRAADAEEALGLLLPRLRPGDVVLAKASRAVGLERLVAGLEA